MVHGPGPQGRGHGPGVHVLYASFGEMSKQLTLFGKTVKETKRAGHLIYKDPISKYEKFIARFFR